MTNTITQHTIRQELEARLSNWAAAMNPAVSIAWENMPFTAPEDDVYIRTSLLPAPTVDPSLGSAHRRYTGTFQLNVVGPANGGTGAAQGLAEEIEALFPRSLSLDGIRIAKTPEIGRGVLDGQTYTVPVLVSYRLDAYS